LQPASGLKRVDIFIALDDFGINDPREVLTDYADIIKVDCMSSTPDEQKAMIKRYGPWKCRMLAEKVETREEFVAAKNLGFVYFPRVFLSSPRKSW